MANWGGPVGNGQELDDRGQLHIGQWGAQGGHQLATDHPEGG
jgi:hypothetical protein